MKAITLIPTHDNDGEAFADAVIEAVLASFYVAFGGCQIEGPFTGVWVHEGVTYREPVLKLTIVITEAQVGEARMLVIAAGETLGQLAMYFEVDRTVDIEIIDLE